MKKALFLLALALAVACASSSKPAPKPAPAPPPVVATPPPAPAPKPAPGPVSAPPPTTPASPPSTPAPTAPKPAPVPPPAPPAPCSEAVKTVVVKANALIPGSVDTVVCSQCGKTVPCAKPSPTPPPAVKTYPQYPGLSETFVNMVLSHHNDAWTKLNSWADLLHFDPIVFVGKYGGVSTLTDANFKTAWSRADTLLECGATPYSLGWAKQQVKMHPEWTHPAVWYFQTPCPTK